MATITDPRTALAAIVTSTISEVLENHPGPDFDAVATDAANAVIDRLKLDANVTVGQGSDDEIVMHEWLEAFSRDDIRLGEAPWTEFDIIDQPIRLGSNVQAVAADVTIDAGHVLAFTAAGECLVVDEDGSSEIAQPYNLDCRDSA